MIDCHRALLTSDSGVTHPDGGLGKVAQVGVQSLSSGDAQKGATQRGPASEAVADEVEEQVVGRQRLEDACERDRTLQAEITALPSHLVALSR